MLDTGKEPLCAWTIASPSRRLRDGHEILRAGKQEGVTLGERPALVAVAWNPSGRLPANAGDTQAQPQAEGPVPVARAVDEMSCGWNPLRPGGSAIGTVKLPVPVWRSGEKVSPMPCRAPPPWGSEIIWLEVLDLFI
jgi:hypothetical protein